MADRAIDLSECEKEPIHLIGAIQPHGFLLAMRANDLLIEQCSANTIDHLGIPPEELIGTYLDALIGRDCCRQLLAATTSDALKAISPMTITIAGKTVVPAFQASLHRWDRLIILEAEPFEASLNKGAPDLSSELTSSFPALFSASKISELFKATAGEIQRITDYDRVLIYQFDQEWNGRVVAEKRRDFMHSYKNQHFPAGDILKQARDLYVKNTLRVLVDVNATPAAIVSPAKNGKPNKPLDLSHSILRSMSPVHIEYLKNMGETASMSVSVLKDGKLWALIACHHKQSKMVHPTTRKILELIAQLLSMLVARMEHSQHMEYRLALKKTEENLLRNLAQHEDLAQSLVSASGDVLESAGARGFALFYEDKLVKAGLTPSPKALGKLREWLNTTEESAVLYTDKLSTIFPGAAGYAEIASGLLAVPINRQSGYWLVWFRPEVIQEVEWAGRPDKAVVVDAKTMRLHPRKSFGLWKEKVLGTAQQWQQCEIETAIEIGTGIRDLALSRSLSRRQRDDAVHQEREQFLLQRENWLEALAHDLKTPAIGAQRLLELLTGDSTLSVAPKQQELLLTLKDANAAQLERINKLLEVFHFETQTGNLRMAPTLLAATVNKCISELKTVAVTNNIEVINENATLSTHVMADADALHRLILNVLDNAIKFSKNGSQVKVRWESQGSRVLLHIKDQGPGISHEDQKHLFKRFWQGSKGKYPVSIGLGLYLCQQIATAIGGQISCASKIGEGSTFTITLPLATVPATMAGRT